ncbi:MAG: RES family NAD+ phosphorylase [Bdellovibrio bacteriovorus]
MMLAYRLVKERWAGSALDGSGAKAYGGRWNSPGTAILYASESIALAALELLVHLGRSQVLGSYRLFTLKIPDASVQRLDASDLPPDWRADPPPMNTARLGDGWAASGQSVALLVPSVIIPREHNLLVSPAHPDFATIAGDALREPFGYDPRLA